MRENNWVAAGAIALWFLVIIFSFQVYVNFLAVKLANDVKELSDTKLQYNKGRIEERTRAWQWIKKNFGGNKAGNTFLDYCKKEIKK